MADQRGDSGFGERGLDTGQRAAATSRNRRAVLLEERARRPRQPVAEKSQPGQVDADALVTDDTVVLGERDAGLVDREAVPHRAGAESGIGERVGPPYRHGLGLDEPGRVDDGADDRVSHLRPRVGRWPRRRAVWSSSAGTREWPWALRPGVHTRLGRVSLQDWPMSSVRSTRPIPTHSAHDNARSASSSSEKCSLQRAQKSSSSRSLVCSVANR